MALHKGVEVALKQSWLHGNEEGMAIRRVVRPVEKSGGDPWVRSCGSTLLLSRQSFGGWLMCLDAGHQWHN